ncbi:hypothetical protein BYT27DRAFT_7213235 [Phlegmacium glaucopus]|nr:hypothetical protein BYT27DRAFT_7213235 [Phlegmacium glaucopus]
MDLPMRNHVSRILKFLGIIYVVRPPAVGKTSIGILGRRFFRFSVELMETLQEMLDPEQNNGFFERYMTRRPLMVLFPTTLTFIPAPLLDRMEVLKVSGYVSEQKSIIASRYLGPQVKEASGLAEADVELESSTVDILLKYYCREIGVRNLMKHIEKRCREHKWNIYTGNSRNDETLSAFLLKDDNTDSNIIADINYVHEVDVFAQITSIFAAAGRGEDDKEDAQLVKLQGWSSEDHRRPTANGGTSDHPPPSPPPERQLAEQNTGPVLTEGFLVTTNVFDKLDKLADSAAAVSTGEVRELQVVLESQVVDDRLPQALLVLKRDLINVQLQNKFSRDVDSIKKELGMESNGNDKLIEKFRERAAALKMCDGVFEEDLAKMQRLIPWGRHTPENHITHAQTVTCRSVGKLRGTIQGKIICLVGPPGVGETSIGKTISGRRFFRLSVGGLTDVAKIKGHRRTYICGFVALYQARSFQALKCVEIETLLVLVDEVDKIGRGINGETLLGDVGS